MPEVSYSDIEGGHDGEGNIDEDPRFVVDDVGVRGLQADSPCVDAGDPGPLPKDAGDLDGDGDTEEPEPKDAAGNARVAGEAVDMGAHEYSPGCGNHSVDPGEECDDGNTEDGDGCTSTCTCEGLGNLKICPAASCSAIEGQSGVYWLDPEGAGEPFEAYCDMTSFEGGWTLVLRLDSNDGTTQQWSADFWTSSEEVGSLGDGTDYLSPAYYSLTEWDEIMLDYRYAAEQAKMMAAVYEGANNSTFKSHTTMAPSNENPAWTRTHADSNTDTSGTAQWYGEKLRFQTVGNGADGNGNDNFRIWYNRVPVDACNQAGGIGGQGDGGAWFHELSFPSETGGCQENTHRGTIGSNGGGDVRDEEPLSPEEAYDNGVMYVYVR